ncbi:MAG: hypothetical protein QHH15_02910 [Candidatus Thermoplasmatota archaeon]|nr:hypothetical protein [Candidatus Thermoplasmatota archaeon]
MLSKKICVLLLFIAFFSFIFSFININVLAEDQPNLISQKNSMINVGVYVLSIGNFELNKGTYLLDFYLIFKWENQNLSPTSFEFMNGRPVTKEKIFEEITNDSSEIWYRIQANLFITPDLTNYPFDSQDIKIVIEDSKFNNSVLMYNIMDDMVYVDENFQLAGWEVQSYNCNVITHKYPWGENYSQIVFIIKLVRALGPNAVKLLLPPIIFCIVSGLSFFFKADKITHRIGLGTSMLISAVMFHLSQTSSLPSLPSLILIDKIMIAVYAFLASSLFATTLIYIDEEYWKDVDYTKYVNRYGAIITIILPFIVFLLLYLF